MEWTRFLIRYVIWKNKHKIELVARRNIVEMGLDRSHIKSFTKEGFC